MHVVKAECGHAVATEWRLQGLGAIALSTWPAQEPFGVWTARGEQRFAQLITDVSGVGAVDSIRLAATAARHGVAPFTAVLVLTDAMDGFAAHITRRIVWDCSKYTLYLQGQMS
jgi:hypothetical protein